MKGYEEYMDRITVDTELHERIMRRMAAARRRPRRFFRYALPAACAAAVLVAAWALLPALDLGWNAETGVNGYPEPPAIVALDGGTLYFNRVASADWAPESTDTAGYFQEEPAAETVIRFFKGRHPVPAGFTLEEASAGYDREGNPVDLSVTYSSGREKIFISMDADCLYLMAESRVSTIHGTAVTAGYWYDPHGLSDTPFYVAYFELHGRPFTVEAASEAALFAETLDLLLERGVDCNVLVPAAIPEWREEKLTLDQARSDPKFGPFVPATVPEGFNFTAATRLSDGARAFDQLILLYESGLRYVRLSIARETPGLESRIVDPDRPEQYDMSLYPIPWAESVPPVLSEKVLHPVFRLEDLTLEILRARAYQAAETGDDNTGYRMQFGIVGGGMLLDFAVKGSTPEEVLRLVQSIPAF